MTSKEIRKQFIEFFQAKDHKYVPSASVIPFDDPTLLFTNAGMNQFKDVFLGTGTREYTRAVDTQKCIRVSGKHNDLEEVGRDTYHHTFFEMLGNWSFGDYYKKEAIAWAWELLTEVWKLPKERLWATVYRTDDEAFELWKSETDINHNHILRFDEKDNFWEMGDTGPCGPCSEIHINLSDDYDNPDWVNAGKEECIEIWNLVFIQYNRDENGKLHDLPSKHVDTGMGFERVCAVIQNKKSNYDTDVFTPIIDNIRKVAGGKGKTEEELTAERVISDHIRTLTFAIADGAVPGNEGRGYVLRRILRRAARFGRKLNLKEPFLFSLVDTIVKLMSEAFPEITEKKDYVKKIIKAEEESFNRTLDRGIELFDEVASRLEKEGKTEIPGDDAFKLYDTYGFPVDLTAVMAEEKGFSIDEKTFNELMEEQKQRARQATKDKISTAAASITGLDDFTLQNDKPTLFTGYDELVTDAVITGYKKENDTVYIILDKTPFYVEAGGQTDDSGYLKMNGTKLPVIDLLKINDRVIHITDANSDVQIETGASVKAEVETSRRWDIMRNHTATHLLHAALRKVLGTHVQQAGSYVGPDRLRFDFTHFQKVTPEELKEIEAIVNRQLWKNIQVRRHRDMDFENAKEMGALMFFGDKYGDKVNVIQIDDFSMEFCGGTHVSNTSQIGIFKILSESSIASGVRRIEALTGKGVEEYIYHQEDKIAETQQKAAALNNEIKKLEKEIQELKQKEKLEQIPALLKNVKEFEDISLYRGKVDAGNMGELKSMADDLREKMKNGVGLLVAVFEDGKVGLVCVVSDNLIKEKRLMAGKIVGDAAKLLGGGGGGKPHLATAGAKDASNVSLALEKLEEIVKRQMG